MTEKEILPLSLAIKAMRNSGYKNTAYAVAELIDNSIQAGAKEVELLCSERSIVRTRTKRNVDQIAVYDNGSGMDSDTLTNALQFGNGMYLNDRKGIGRFGMGLPASSISQCQLLEVWTWQNGIESAKYSYIDVRKCISGEQRGIPVPKNNNIPEIWRRASNINSKSGTLVVWSAIDRCLWRTGDGVIRNSASIIGRIYRHFILDKRVNIRMKVFNIEDPSIILTSTEAEANDPMYLMVPSSTPTPFNTKAMFEPDGERWEVPWEIDFMDKKHEVIVRFSLAKDEARQDPNAGSKAYGKHAKQNIGVSLLRADRELSLDTSLVGQSEPRDRWWGVEIEFSPELDDVFGVTNNKQSATHFPEVSQMIDEGEVSGADALEFEDDPRMLLFEVISFVRRRIGNMQKILRAQTKNQRTIRHINDDAERRGTKVTEELQEEGHIGASDEDTKIPIGKRTELLKEDLIQFRVPASAADDIVKYTISNGLKYVFVVTNLDGNTFFSVKPVAGVIEILLNSDHPAYTNLVELSSEDSIEELSSEDLADRLNRTKNGLKLLLMSWARFEDEAMPDKKRRQIQDIRNEWGKFAALFLEEDR